MCRLLAIYGEVDGWAEVALGFRKLADDGMVPPICTEPGHKDGWGMAGASHDQTTMLEIERQLGSANDSVVYEEAIQSLEIQPRILLCHIRKASPGIPVTIGNVHPFLYRNWAFIHNGTIYDYDTLAGDWDFQMTSDGSDSEYFFSYLLEKMKTAVNGNDRLKVIGEAMASLKLNYTSLNCILCNGSELFAVRDYMKFGEYLSLFYCRLPKGVIICSEPLDLAGLDKNRWQMMPNKSILRIQGTPPALDFLEYKSLR